MSAENELTPEEAVEILKKGGLVVTTSQAVEILKFLNTLAKISLENSLAEAKNN